MEGLRGLAIILVFLQHYCRIATHNWHLNGAARWLAIAFSSYGNFGVELFFVLSGYLIYRGLILGRAPFATFAMRRAQRIYPAFLVVFCIYALFHPATADKPVGDLAYLIKNLLFLPGLFPIKPLMDVAWSLSYEIFFYLLIGALVSLLALRERSRAFRLVIIALMAGTLTLASALHIHGVPIRALPFFGGMLLAEVSITEPFSAFSLLVLASAFFLGVTMTLGITVGEWVQSAAFVMLTAGCVAGRGLTPQLFSWKPLRWLGNMSYSFYLAHGLAINTALLLVIRPLADFSHPDLAFWLLVPLIFCACLVPSAALFILIEKPFSLTRRKAHGVSVEAAATPQSP